MRMLWDPHKARARKRKQKVMRARHKKMLAVISNIYWAYEHYKTFGKVDDLTFYRKVYTMDHKYGDWVTSKVLQPYCTMSAHDLAMDEMCRLMLLWRETSDKRNEALEEARKLQEQAKNLKAQERAIHALFRHKMRKHNI